MSLKRVGAILGASWIALALYCVPIPQKEVVELQRRIVVLAVALGALGVNAVGHGLLRRSVTWRSLTVLTALGGYLGYYLAVQEVPMNALDRALEEKSHIFALAAGNAILTSLMILLARRGLEPGTAQPTGYTSHVNWGKRVQPWHPGKLLLLWGLSVLFLVILLAANPSSADNRVPELVSWLVLVSPVAVVTWLWLSSREGSASVVKDHDGGA